MLDIKFIRENLKEVKKSLGRRNGSCPDLDALLEQENERYEQDKRSKKDL